MPRKLAMFLIIYTLMGGLLATAYLNSQNTEMRQTKQQPTKVVYIYGDKPLSRAFAKIFESMGYKVIILKNEQPEQKPTMKIRGDTKPPQVEITNPANNSYVSGNTSLTILASDNVSVDTVILYIDGQQKQTWSGAGTYTYYWNTTAYNDGQHTVEVWANDTSGNTNSTTYKYTVDNTAPTVTIQSPSEGAYLGTNNVTVTWTGSDNIQIDHYEVSLDGQSPVNVGTQTNYTFYGVDEGNHNVTVYAYDKAGNMDSNIVSFTVDTLSPVVTIINPASGEWFNIENVTVSWTANDTGSGIDYYEIRIDSGAWINVGLNTSYTFTNLDEGNHTIDVRAYDKAGNSGTDSITFGVDLTEPTVTITSPSDGDYVNTSDVYVEWIGNETISGIDHYEVRCQNSTWDSGWINVGTVTHYTFPNLADGQYTIYVKAIDLAGNVGVDSIEITVDTVAPSVMITDPANNSVVGGSSVSIDVTSSDLHPNKTWLTINGNIVQTWDGDGGFSYIWNTTGYGDGVYEVIAYANDTVGNVGSYRILVTVDNTGPDVHIVSPVDGAYVNGVVTIIFNASDPNNVSLVELYIDGNLRYSNNIEVQSATYTWDWDTSTEPEGNHTISVTAYDILNNINSVEITVCVDKTAPNITITSPANNTEFTSSGDVTIQWIASDNYELDKFKVYLNGSLKDTLDSSATDYTFYGLPNAYYNATVVAYDKAGNTDRDYVIFRVNVPFYVDIESPENDSWHNSTQIQITINYVNKTSTVMNITLYINKTKKAFWEYGTNLTRPIYYNFIPLKEGIYNITAVMKDDVGQVDLDTIWIHIDWTLPSVSINAPSNNVYVSGEVMINVTWYDDNPDRCELFIGGNSTVNWTSIGPNSYNWKTFKVSDGQYVIRAVAYDLAGNSASANITVTVDNTPPIVNINAPSDKAYVSGVVMINVTWYDDNPDRCELFIGGNSTVNWTSTGYNIYNWNTSEVSDGNYVIRAVAHDLAGNSASANIRVTVDNTPPSVSFDAPTNNSYVKGLVDIVVRANDNKALKNVTLYINDSLEDKWNETGQHIYIWNTTGLDDGLYKILVIAYDMAGNIASIYIYLTSDNTPPSVTITKPAPEEILNVSDVYVSWTGSDNISGIDHYWIRCDSDPWIDVNDSTWYVFNGLPEGTHTVDVQAFDKAGNTRMASVTFHVDLSSPIVKIVDITPSAHVGGDIHTTPTFTLKFNYSDNVSNIVLAEVYLNGTLYMSQLLGQISGSSEVVISGLNVGQYYNVSVCVYDGAGWTGVDYVIVYITRFLVSIAYPKDHTYINTSYVLVQWEFFPIGIGKDVNNVTIYVDGLEVYTTNQNITSYNVTGLSPNAWHNITVFAMDKSDNTATDTVFIYIDTLAPNLWFVSISPSYYNMTIGMNVTTVGGVITWNGSDDKGIAYYMISIDGGTWINVSVSMTYIIPDSLSEGIHNLSVKAVDLAGNSNRAILNFVVDKSPPSLKVKILNTYINPGYYNISQLAIKIMVGDKYSDYNGTILIYINNVLRNRTSELIYITPVLASGDYNLTVVAFDVFNQTAKAEVLFCIDTEEPTVTLIRPIDEEVIKGTTVKAEWNVSDIYSGKWKVEIKLDDNEWRDVTDRTSYEFTNVTPGNHIIYIRVIDKAGNIGRDSVSFSIVVKPSVQFDLSGWFLVPCYYNTTDITLTINVTAYVDYELWVYINGTPKKIGSYDEPISGKVVNITVDGEGVYNISIEVSDKYGDRVLDSKLVYVDLTAPIITISSPSIGVTITTDTVGIEGVVSDDFSGVYKIYVRLDGESWREASLYENGTFAYVFADLSEGTHSVDIKALDKAGNIRRTSLSFVVTVTTTTPIKLLIGIMLAIPLAVIIAIVVVLKRKKEVVTPEEAEAAEALREVVEYV